MAIDQSEVNLEQLRARLRGMRDDELLRFGRDARFMCSPKADLGQPAREVFIIQLKEARAEWRRRNPKDNSKSGSESK